MQTNIQDTQKIDFDKPKLTIVSLSELLAMELPAREYLLAPWLPKSGLCMVYAKRGVGKTFFALEVAMAVAYGIEFLSFYAPNPAKVLYIDGEMPAKTMQERLAAIAERMNITNKDLDPIFITPDLQDGFMPNLGNTQEQSILNDYTEQADLIIVDNISTLSCWGKENEAESWIPLQQWALSLRKKGKSVLFIHHAGKNGTARGTSKREDILDTVISLRHPSDYTPAKGACFEVHFEKARGMLGDDVSPLLCQLTDNGWDYSKIDGTTNAQLVIELYNQRAKQIDIANKLDISKGQVSKIITRAREEGKLIN